MTKQKEIRERFAIEFYLWSVPSKPWTKAEEWKKGICLSIADELLEYLHSQSVVIKVDRELPENPFDAEVARYSNRPVDEEATLDEHVVVCSSNGFEKGKSVMLKWHNDSLEPLIGEDKE